jgi:predicted DNA-binding transcriptional regulator AlpA
MSLEIENGGRETLSDPNKKYAGKSLMKVEEVCAYLKISKAGFYKNLHGENNKSGFPKPVRVLSDKRWVLAEVNEWIMAQRVH